MVTAHTFHRFAEMSRTVTIREVGCDSHIILLNTISDIPIARPGHCEDLLILFISKLGIYEWSYSKLGLGFLTDQHLSSLTCLINGSF